MALFVLCPDAIECLARCYGIVGSVRLFHAGVRTAGDDATAVLVRPAADNSFKNESGRRRAGGFCAPNGEPEHSAAAWIVLGP